MEGTVAGPGLDVPGEDESKPVPDYRDCWIIKNVVPVVWCVEGMGGWESASGHLAMWWVHSPRRGSRYGV